MFSINLMYNYVDFIITFIQYTVVNNHVYIIEHML